MKKIALIMAIAALMVSCRTTSGVTNGMSKAEREAYVAEQVYNGLNELHYTIEVSHMTQRRGGMRTLSGGYELEIKGDTVISYLPYFGDVYAGRTVPYGQQKGLNFTSRIYNYAAVMEKQGEYRIQFETETDEDRYLYTIQLFDNGKSYIDVLGENRTSISFIGNMKIAY
jgi:hypothetical protein